MDKRESTAKKLCWSQAALYSVAETKDTSSNLFPRANVIMFWFFSWCKSDTLGLCDHQYQQNSSQFKGNCFKMVYPRESSFCLLIYGKSNQWISIYSRFLLLYSVYWWTKLTNIYACTVLPTGVLGIIHSYKNIHVTLFSGSGPSLTSFFLGSFNSITCSHPHIFVFIIL